MARNAIATQARPGAILEGHGVDLSAVGVAMSHRRMTRVVVASAIISSMIIAGTVTRARPVRSAGGRPGSAFTIIDRSPDHGEPVAPTPDASTALSSISSMSRLGSGTVDVAVDGFFSWALLDRETGGTRGSTDVAATNSTESMIKIWIVSDFLRLTAMAGKTPTPSQLGWASTAIRDSNDVSAEKLFNLGGRASVISRLIDICGLTNTRAVTPPGASTIWWSYTKMSARDAVRMGACVGDGRAAGQQWTGWVLNEMASVTGTADAKDQHATWGGGRWGIIDGLPKSVADQGVSIKNGATLINADDSWHVDCLAVHTDWVLAVLLRYPRSHSLQYGADICKTVAQQLFPNARPPAPGNVRIR
jgi:hypothetical protein